MPNLTVVDRSTAAGSRCVFGKGFRSTLQKPLAPPCRLFRRDAEFSSDFAVLELDQRVQREVQRAGGGDRPRTAQAALWVPSFVAVLTRQGWAVNVNRIYRLYREEGLLGAAAAKTARACGAAELHRPREG